MTMAAYRIQILSFTVSISGPDDVLDAMRIAFPAALEWPGTPTQGLHLNLCVIRSHGAPSTWSVVEDGVITHICHSSAELELLLIWLINSRAVEWIGKDHLLFHAGAVAIGQTGIILAGRSGSGKSTLTAALVAEGLAYFSDEVAVVGPDSGALLPFRKAIKLEPGSVPVLAGRYAALTAARPPATSDDHEPTYLRPPDEAWPSTAATPKLVIFPRYEPHAQTRITVLSRSTAFERLLAHSFSARHQGADGVRQVVRLLESCACYELTMDNLDDAVRAVMLAAG